MTIEKPKPMPKHDFIIKSIAGRSNSIELVCDGEATKWLSDLSDFGQMNRLRLTEYFLEVDDHFDLVEVVAYIIHTMKAHVGPAVYSNYGIKVEVDKLLMAHKVAEHQPNATSGMIIPRPTEAVMDDLRQIDAVLAEAQRLASRCGFALIFGSEKKGDN